MSAAVSAEVIPDCFRPIVDAFPVAAVAAVDSVMLDLLYSAVVILDEIMIVDRPKLQVVELQLHRHIDQVEEAVEAELGMNSAVVAAA